MKPYPSFRTVPRYYLSLNISETVKDTAIDAVEDEQETIPWLLRGNIFNDIKNLDFKVTTLFNVK